MKNSKCIVTPYLIALTLLFGCKSAPVSQSETLSTQVRISDAYNRIYTGHLVLEPLKRFETNDAFNILKDPEVRKSFKPISDDTILDGLKVSANQKLQALAVAKNGLVLPLSMRQTVDGPMIGIAQMIVHEPPKLLLMRLVLQNQVKVPQDTTWTELSVSISPAWWGRGYGTETLEGLVKLGDKKIQKPMYWTSVLNHNERSKNLMEKISFIEFPTIQYESGLPFEGLLEPVDPNTRYYFFHPKR